MTIDTAALRKRFKTARPWLIGLGVIVIAFALFQIFKPKGDEEPYRLQAVSRGSIVRSVSASGTLQALVTVEVGSQISGQVTDVLVDFDDQVVEGQVLARIDPRTYVSRLGSAQAEVAASTQGVNSARANLGQTQANIRVAEAAHGRTKALFDKGFVAKAAMDTADADLANARAALQVAQAGVNSAQARLQQSRAAVDNVQIDLGRAVIRSPITGVVVDRQVDPGQTVAASLSAPILFNIAQDLSKLEIKILVDEADIGQVAQGQAVDFTVDAFPGETYRGLVTQVRKQPETQNNVVAYVVIAQADNPDRKLLPGMTANAEIILERKQNVLRAPTAALRWLPADQQAPQQRGGGFGGGGRPAQQGDGAGGGERGGGRNMMLLYDQLSLTPAQSQKIDKIMTDQREDNRKRMEEMQKATRRGDQVDRQAFAAQSRERQAKVREEVEALLNPAQRAKLQELMSQRGRGRAAQQRGQVYILQDEKAVRVGVGVGIADGSNTEIVTDSLRPADQVIIGGGPKPKAQGPAGLGGGMRAIR